MFLSLPLSYSISKSNQSINTVETMVIEPFTQNAIYLEHLPLNDLECFKNTDA